MNQQQLDVDSHQPLRLAAARLWWLLPLVVIVAVLVNLAARWIAPTVIDLPADFVPLYPSSIMSLTVIGVVGATLAMIVVAHFSTRPRRDYLRVVLAALVVTGLPNLAIGLNPASFSFSGASWAIAVFFILLHITTAIVCLLLLSRLALRPAETS